jgi:cell division protein YceG involved in septum cleavage
MKIVTTGKYLDGSTVNKKYWFVPPIQPNVKFALEGYLFPDTYNFFADDDETAVINRLLDAFGEQLCPGPDAAHADAYLTDKAQCKAHATKVGDSSIFTLLEKKYATSDDTTALYRALTIASLVMREVSQSKPDIQAVTNVYYNRWLVSLQDGTNPAGDMVANLGGVPTAHYARDTYSPAKDGVYWKPLNGVASTISPNNPYNTNNPVHKGLMPGPISAPVWTHIADAINPNPSGATPNYFFWASCQGGKNTIHYAANYADFQAGLNQFPATTC